MPAFVLGVIVLVLLLFAAYSFSKADPKQAVRVLRYVGGGAALLFALFLLVRGAIGPAVSIGQIGLGLLGYVSLWRASLGGRTQKSPGQVSRVRTAFLEMELDHDSGALRGQVLAGRHQGAALDDLDLPTLITVRSAICRPPSLPNSAFPECNETGRCATSRAPRPAPLHHRANKAQMMPGLSPLADEIRGSAQDASCLLPRESP